jgi:rSAM/selenodomain-associated transferase 1
MTGMSVLGIFAKQPQPGRVKTRLCPPLTPLQAAELYRCSLQETVDLAARGAWTRMLFYRGERRYFRNSFPDVPLTEQRGADLGERLAEAFASRFAEGARKVVIIGSDSPDLPPTLIGEAFAALNQYDAVVAPADDGGYVLIGLRRNVPELFTDIPWSTDRVLAVTRQRMTEQRLSFLKLPGWYDLDDVAGLRQIMRRSPKSGTARLAARLLDGTAP